MLPVDFPKMGIVHYYYDVWSPTGRQHNLAQRGLKKSSNDDTQRRYEERQNDLRFIDAQSVQNADTAGEKGYDAGKKVSGIKRHIVVDSQGLPHAVMVTTANITDRQGALLMLAENPDTLSRVEKYLVDGGYSGEKFAEAVKAICGAEVQVVKRSELHRFVVLPQRWVVERIFGRLDKSRRLRKNCERKLHYSLQMVIFAFIAVLIRRF